MKLLELTGKHAVGDWKHTIVDDEDYERCINVCHTNKNKGYVMGSIDGKYLSLHRFLMNFPESCVDHKNRNTFDNQKSNLRLATHSQNNMNKSSARNSSSKYIGVHLDKKRNRWIPTVRVNTKIKRLGLFKLEDEAGEIRDLYALYHYGDFASLNFPNKLEEYLQISKNYNFNKEWKFSSDYYGVSWREDSKKWKSSMQIDNKKIHIGLFEEEDYAAEIYDLYNLKYRSEKPILNFPEKIEEYKIKIQSFDFEQKDKYTSNYSGVSWNQSMKKWKSQTRINKSVVLLGYFSDELQAALAYDKALIENNLVGQKHRHLNFPEENYAT